MKEFKSDPKTFTPPKQAQRLSKNPIANRGRLIRQMDNTFSLFIRRRAMENGKVVCFTCGAKMTLAQSQCSHFIHRSNMATRYDEVNNQAACWSCNVLKEGNLQVFRANLIKKYGQKEFARLESLRHAEVKLSSEDISEMIKKYR